VIGEGKYIHVIPSVYDPKPAPIPSRKPAPKRKVVKQSKARRRREVNHPPKYWTEERVKTLIDLYDQGLIYADIALHMETSRNAVNSKINRLVVQKVLQPRKQEDQWEQEEVDRLVDLKKSGKTIAEISDILGKSKNSCYKVWGRWNDKQDSFRGIFDKLDNSGKCD
jgi:DNA-binding CsgD family transcriptional regulator